MKRSERGSIFLYILGAIALLGVLVLTLTGGPQKNALTAQVDDLARGLEQDVRVVLSAVDQCTLQYADPVDVDGNGTIDASDNPNAPFPLYKVAGVKGSSGGTGVTLNFSANNLVCPGAAPVAASDMPDVFNVKNASGLRILNRQSAYSLHYRNETGAGKEGVLFRITRSSANAVWEEAAARVQARFSPCKAAYVKDGAVDGGACANGCLYIWVLRLATTSIVVNDDGATCTSP